MSTREELLSKIDIVDFISEYVDLTKAGSNYKGYSPFKKENTPSFVVSPEKNIFKDFSSQKGGDAIRFYSYIKDIPYNEAMYELALKYGINVKKSKTIYDENQKYYDELKLVTKHFTENLLKNEEALNYLKSRDYDESDIKFFKLGYATSDYKDLKSKFNDEILLELGLITNKNDNVYDTFINRITLPIFNIKGNIIGFGARDISNRENSPKYLNSKETKIFKKGEELFGIYDGGKKIKEYNNVILVEGFFDVLRLHKNGIANAVGSLGTALTDKQVLLLSKLTRNIVIAYDEDEAGINATIRAIYILNKYGFNIKIMSLNGLAKDPDEFIQKYGKARFINEFNKSIDAFDFLYKNHIKGYDINKHAAKMEIISKLREYFNTISNRIYFEEAVRKFAFKLNISYEALNSLIQYNTNIKKVAKPTRKNNNLAVVREETTLEEYTIFLLANCKEERNYYLNFIYSDEYKGLFKKLLRNDFTESDLDEKESNIFFHINTKIEKDMITDDFKHNLYSIWVENYIKESLQNIYIFSFEGNYENMNDNVYKEYMKFQKALKELKLSKSVNDIRNIYMQYLDFEKNII